MNYPYTITIETEIEWNSLGWLAGRYASADALWSLLSPIDEEWDGESFPMSFGLKESEVWQVADAVEAEDSHSIPCLGGRLAKEVYSMLESIV